MNFGEPKEEAIGRGLMPFGGEIHGAGKQIKGESL